MPCFLEKIFQNRRLNCLQCDTRIMAKAMREVLMIMHKDSKKKSLAVRTVHTWHNKHILSFSLAFFFLVLLSQERKNILHPPNTIQSCLVMGSLAQVFAVPGRCSCCCCTVRQPRPSSSLRRSPLLAAAPPPSRSAFCRSVSGALVSTQPIG